MRGNFFMTTGRLGFGRWTEEMLPEARLLWDDPEVSRYICAAGTFSDEEIRARLQKEIENDRLYGIQYWPIFTLEEEIIPGAAENDGKLEKCRFSEEENPDNAPSLLVGCCGLRPHSMTGKTDSKDTGVPQQIGYELGFHLRPQFWHKGYATEAAAAVIARAFDTLGADYLFAGHNPANVRSRTVLERLGFTYIGDEYYAPTGLYHPSYVLKS